MSSLGVIQKRILEEEATRRTSAKKVEKLSYEVLSMILVPFIFELICPLNITPLLIEDILKDLSLVTERMLTNVRDTIISQTIWVIMIIITSTVTLLCTPSGHFRNISPSLIETCKRLGYHHHIIELIQVVLY